MTPHYRMAAAGDIPRLLEMLDDIVALHQQGRPDIFRPGGCRKYTEDQLRDLLAAPDTPIFVAADEQDQVVGYIFAQIHRYHGHPVYADRDELYIDDFCVLPSLRGQHVGTQLFSRFRDYAVREGFDAIYLNVWEFNESAVRFYESLGMVTRSRHMELRLH